MQRPGALEVTETLRRQKQSRRLGRWRLGSGGDLGEVDSTRGQGLDDPRSLCALSEGTAGSVQSCRQGVMSADPCGSVRMVLQRGKAREGQGNSAQSCTSY